MKKVVDFLKSTAGMVLIVTLLAGCVVHLVTGNFWTAYNISTLTRSAAFVIIVSFGQTLVLQNNPNLKAVVDTPGILHSKRNCRRFSILKSLNLNVNL